MSVDNYSIEFDEREEIYIATNLNPKRSFITGHGKTPDEAKQMAEENLASLRCVNCGHVEGEPLDNNVVKQEGN